MSNVSYYTAEGLKKLKEELNQLRDIERPKASQAIAEARDKGDLSENAEYDAAKEAQGLLEMRISKMEETLANARLIDESQLDTSKVLVLSTVKLKNQNNGMEMKYTQTYMSSIFTKIINGEIPCYKIAEDDNFFAFLDINPNAKGHTLCISKKEVDKILDLDEETYLGLMAFARTVGKAIEAAIECKRVGMTIIGLEVPHVHVHLIPLNSMREATFQQKVTLEPEEFEAIAERIRSKM